jgi:arginyl-tRNA synthetase
MLYSKSLQKQIEKNLQKQISLWVNQNDLVGLSIKIDIHNKGKNITYKSPICLQLAKILKDKPIAIANQIIKEWKEQEIGLQISCQSWLEFTISDFYLSKWLKDLATNKINLNHDVIDIRNLRFNYEIPFNLIYAHTRCCSLLRSAHRDNLIELANFQFQDFSSYWKIPQTLGFSERFLANIWHKKLIRELAIVIDHIESNYEQNWFLITTNLSKTILDFERYCRIWGEVKDQNIKLSQARLALLALCQTYLQWTVKAKLGVVLPLELN